MLRAVVMAALRTASTLSCGASSTTGSSGSRKGSEGGPTVLAIWPMAMIAPSRAIGLFLSSAASLRRSITPFSCERGERGEGWSTCIAPLVPG
jgi:hypothetical protein